MVDAGSFGAGYGAGQSSRRGIPASVTNAERLANEQLARANTLEGEINNRWIPYAVTLRASLVARRVERGVLVDALKRLDPANAEQIIEQAEQARVAEYATMKVHGAKLHGINQTVMTESEEERLDR